MTSIQLRGLTKRYGQHVTALDGLTLDVEPGIIGLVGANGAGKSTFLKILLGRETPDAGKVVLGKNTVLADQAWHRFIDTVAPVAPRA